MEPFPYHFSVVCFTSHLKYNGFDVLRSLWFEFIIS
jgi:hypothetical protein